LPHLKIYPKQWCSKLFFREEHRNDEVDDGTVKKELAYIWDAYGLCGTRMKAMMSDIMPSLVMRGRFEAEEEIYGKLLQISAATIDRLLGEQQAKRKPEGNTHTRPTSLLKLQIPILISSQLNTNEPGHCQIDLVPMTVAIPTVTSPSL